MRLGFLLALLGSMLLSFSVAHAQDGKLSKKQKQLNEDGVKAIVDGNYDRAIELFNDSLALGELNVTYLNLGRAYAKLGRCNEALEKYDRMAVAPRVSSPSPEDLYKILTRYRTELFDECPGQVILRCRPATLMVSIDGAEPIPCPTKAIELLPGTHSFVGILDDLRNENSAETKGMSTSYVDIEVVPPQSAQLLVSNNPVIVDSGASALAISGWTSLGVGAGLLIAATLFDMLAISPAVDDFDAALANNDIAAARALQSSVQSAQTANLVFFVSGGSLLALGLTLVVVDAMNSSSADRQGVSFWMQPDAGGVSFSTRF